MPNLSEKYMQLKSNLLTKDSSVFAEFKDETAQLQKQMVDHDLKNWKVSRIVKIDFDVSFHLFLIDFFFFHDSIKA